MIPDEQARRAAVQAAVTQAAARLGVTADEVTVEQVEMHDWPDTSLGCPQPGAFYAQVITPGHMVILAAGGSRLEYHTDARGQEAVFCRTL